MRVYRSITTDIETGEIIAEDSYEYCGPIAKCEKGGGIFGGPAGIQQTLQNMQLRTLIENDYQATLAKEGETWGRGSGGPPLQKAPMWSRAGAGSPLTRVDPSYPVGGQQVNSGKR